MSPSRQQICRDVSARLTAAGENLPSIKAVIGFDGFVDQIISVVDKRRDMDHYDLCRTIGDLARKIAAAAGHSSNYELVINETRLGGNGPLMSNALAAAGMNVTCIGSTGYPSTHPAFGPLAQRGSVIGISQPGVTDALEFDDGKLMLNKVQSLNDVNWTNLSQRFGIDKFLDLAQQSKLIGMVNWTMLIFMSEIWQKMVEQVLPRLQRAGKILFVDLSDPERRPVDDLRQALGLLTTMQAHLDVTLGMNLKESVQVAKALGLPPQDGSGNALVTQARAVRQKLNLSCVVIHPRNGAAGATASESAWFDGPFVHEPRISTGAGDHFNAGFCLGRVLGMDLPSSLCAGVTCSGYYVRMAQSATAEQLAEFARELPPPQ